MEFPGRSLSFPSRAVWLPLVNHSLAHPLLGPQLGPGPWLTGRTRVGCDKPGHVYQWRDHRPGSKSRSTSCSAMNFLCGLGQAPLPF